MKEIIKKSILGISVLFTLIGCSSTKQVQTKTTPFRGFMIDAPRGMETMDYYFRLIDFCHDEDINAIIFRLTDDQGSAYKFTSHPELKISEGAFNAEELKRLVKYAQSKGIEMIPEIESFGHSKYITQTEKYKFLNDAPPGANFNALCPVNDSTLILLKDLYEEVATIFPSDYFHIGCDEVNWGASEKSKKALQSKSKGQIWATYVNQLNGILKGLNKKTVIWGDVPIYQEEEVLDLLNKDIVIIDWNYWETNTDTIAKVANKVLDKGFELISCPAVSWCEWAPRVGALQFKNITAYAKVYNNLNTPENLGIILSNWVPTRYLQNSQWDTYTIAARIINNKVDGNYMNVIPEFVEEHFGVTYNEDWNKIYKTLYEEIPQWGCGQNDSLIFVPWNSKEHLKDLLDRKEPKKNSFSEIAKLMAAYGAKITKNKTDFNDLRLTVEFIDYCINRQNTLFSFIRKQQLSPTSAKNYFKKIAEEDKAQLHKMNNAWMIGRLSQNPEKINENYLWSFNKAAEYSKLLSEDPGDFIKIINSYGKIDKADFSKLRVSIHNPHLLETIDGVPIFLNNYTVWKLIKNGTHEEISEVLTLLKKQKFNSISFVLLNGLIAEEFEGYGYTYSDNTSKYGTLPFAPNSKGDPDVLRPLTTKRNNPDKPKEYDYWDHVDYTIDLLEKNNMYACINPTWGVWVSGNYTGPKPDDKIIFNKKNAYAYGLWLGQRYGNKDNIIWMLGGDRSAVYEMEDGRHDFKEVWNAMAEGLADGTTGGNVQNGKGDYSNILISYHPRKWAPNSSEWFHNEKWLSFNSVQDTPYDQIVSLPHDYGLKPIKPTWLFEGRYEGATSAWAVRYQAYQTIFDGGFGHTYGNDNWLFNPNWRKIADLPGAWQMAHLYTVCREIWTDSEFLDRMPDPELINGERGNTIGDGMTIGDGDGGPNAGKKPNATSDRISAIRGKNGRWAMVYSANGRNISLNLARLQFGELSAYWFNPRKGTWWVGDKEYDDPKPFLAQLKTGSGNHDFNPPGIPGPDNDWVLVLK